MEGTIDIKLQDVYENMQKWYAESEEERRTLQKIYDLQRQKN
jgi:hypothetical protein